MGTEGVQAVWYHRSGPKPQAGVVLAQNAVTAYILLNGNDLPCIVPVTHLTFCP